jgi:HAD domain in Swiss Army Knife RNA repair proteins
MNSKFCWVENPYDYKVIFLDIDGVINIKGEGEFNTRCMDNLLTLIDDETRIVISSSWRTNDRMKNLLTWVYITVYGKK